MDVKTFTNSGMIAPASVPQVMIDDSFHHSVVSPARFGISNHDRAYVSTTETMDVSHTSDVSGASKFILVGVFVLCFRDGAVDEVAEGGSNDHQDAHAENPDQQLHLHDGIFDGAEE